VDSILRKYGKGKPQLFGGWQRWTFWQFSPAYNAGSEIPFDLDRYSRSMAELKALAQGKGD
jgi:hypothetical protein